MLKEELIAILACPACHTKLELIDDKWLVCQNPECHHKYPIVDEIPRMLVEIGAKYKDVAVSDLPEPQE